MDISRLSLKHCWKGTVHVPNMTLFVGLKRTLILKYRQHRVRQQCQPLTKEGT
jgi:hypothetical protein